MGCGRVRALASAQLGRHFVCAASVWATLSRPVPDFGGGGTEQQTQQCWYKATTHTKIGPIPVAAQLLVAAQFQVGSVSSASAGLRARGMECNFRISKFFLPGMKNGREFPSYFFLA